MDILATHTIKTAIKRTPVILQMESSECGATCLGIILAYYGCHVPLEELRIVCDVSRDGMDAKNIPNAARQYEITCKTFKKSLSKAIEEETPYIVFWNFRHFVVVEGFRGHNVYINDPSTGRKRISLKEFDKSFTGIVFTLKPNKNFQKRKKQETVSQKLYSFVKGSKTALLYLFIVTLLLAIPGIVIPVFSRVFIDYYLIDHQYSWIIPLICGMLLTMFLRGALTWAQKYYLLRLETKIALNSSSTYMAHLLKLPIPFFNQRFSGDIANRVELNDRIAQLLSGELASAVLNIIMVFFFVVVMLQYDITLTIIAVAIASINIMLLQFLAKKRIQANTIWLSEQSKLASITVNGIHRIETIKSTGNDFSYFSLWTDHQAKMVNSRQKLMILNMSTTVIQPFLATINNVVVLGFGAYKVMNGYLSIGMLVALQSLLQSFLQPFGQLMNIGGKFQEVEGSIKRLNDVLCYSEDPHLSQVFTPLQQNVANKLAGYVEIKNLTFGYSRLKEPLIENFSLTIKPGQRIALIGSTGSGKSTIIKILSGIYKPWQGEILLDGRSQDEIFRGTINNSIALVDQNIVLFEGSVRDNLTLWNSAIPERQIIESAKKACIHDEIVQRKEGYDSFVEEGGRNFSGGQCQRLEIARALLINPAILLLDEATNALDSTTEKKIDDNIRRAGCTCIIVAHRLSTIRDCDEIILLDKGKIVARGSHQELMGNCENYEKLLKASML